MPEMLFSPARLRAWRKLQDLLQGELARRLGYSRPLITRYESGSLIPPRRFWELFHHAYPAVDPRQFFRASAP